MEFSILGPVEVTVDGRPLGLSGARARAVLATLIVHANRVITAGQLVDELWPIAGARYFEQPGDHSLRFAGSGDSDALFREIAGFLSGVRCSQRARP